MATILLLFAVLGACVGSFLSVVLTRTHAATSFWRGRSMCDSCQKTLSVFELIPLMSFLLLRGTCRHCHKQIGWQDFLVELATAVLFAIIGGVWFWTSGDFIQLVRDLLITSFLILLFVYDLRYQILPDVFTLPAIIAAIGLNLWLGMPALSLVLGMVVIGGFFWLQWRGSQGTWVGGGDIRFGLLMGAILGFSHGLVALFLAYVSGALVGVVLLLLKRVHRKTPIPFGAFLSGATFLVLMTGDRLLNWYLSWFV